MAQNYYQVAQRKLTMESDWEIKYFVRKDLTEKGIVYGIKIERYIDGYYLDSDETFNGLDPSYEKVEKWAKMMADYDVLPSMLNEIVTDLVG